MHLYAFSIFISIVLMAEQNGYYKNNAIFDTNQYQQQKQLQQKRGQQRNYVLSLADNLRFEMQQMQQQKEEEEEEEGENENEDEDEKEREEQQMRKQHAQHIFDPFDLNNLRQLEEKQKCIHKWQQKQKQSNAEKEQKPYNNNNNSNGYFNNYNELDQQQKQQKEHRQQLRQLQHPSQYKDNENGNSKNNNKYKPNSSNNNNNNNNHDNNEANEYKTGYSYYLFDNKSNSDNSKNKHFNDVDDNNYNKVHNNKNNINEHNGYDDDDVVDYRNGNPNNSDWATPSSTHQDASNDFRLQLLDRNEHVSYKNKSNSGNNNKYHNNNKNPKSNKESGDYSMYDNNGGHRNSRTGESNFHKSTTREASTILINNNNENNNKSENNRPNQSDGDGTDATNGHTIKIRDSQSYGIKVDPNTDLADSEYSDYYNADEEAGIDLPNDIQDVRKRAARKNSAVELRPTSISYQSLCPTKRIHIPLETVGYEYRPSHYVEVTCVHSYSLALSIDQSKNRICSEAGFTCIQLNRTIHLIRRNKKATVECWESEIRIVPWGCECMWPKHSNGDIITYHDTQKRFNPNEKPSSHTLKAAGYEKFPRQIQMINQDGTHREDNEEIGYATYLID